MDNENSSQQLLRRLQRDESTQTQEYEMVFSPGARQGAWAVSVIAQDSFNAYFVRILMIDGPGSNPAKVGEPLLAFNLAEPFDEQGTLPANTCAIMVRAGDKFVFYAKE